MPVTLSAGKIVASKRVYVGLQLLNIGPRAAPRNIAHQVHPFLFAFSRDFWDHFSIPVTSINQGHNFGKMSVREKRTNIPPETYSQNTGSTCMNTVDTLSKRVKTSNEKIKEPMIIYGLHLFCPARLPERITGRSGSTHGAKTVRTPARKLKRRREKSIELFFKIWFKDLPDLIPELVRLIYSVIDIEPLTSCSNQSKFFHLRERLRNDWGGTIRHFRYFSRRELSGFNERYEHLETTFVSE